MNETILQEILEETNAAGDDALWLGRALDIVDRAAGKAGIAIERTRWLAIGVHLAAAVVRGRTGERLPDIDESVACEIRVELRGLSAAILTELREAGGAIEGEAESILLAVHLQCAQDGF